MKKNFVYISVFLFPLWITGQTKGNFDEFRKNLLKGYSSFHETTMNNYKSFRDSINQEYAKALNKTWNKKEIKEEIPIPEWDIKPVPPIIRDKEREENLPPIEQVPILIAPQPVIEKQPQPYIPIDKDGRQVDTRLMTVVFYGENLSINVPERLELELGNLDNKSVSDAWLQLASSIPEKMLADCLSLRDKHQLCDWAYLNLLKSISEEFCGGKTNSSVMMQAYLYCQSGYKMRLARSSNRLYLLYASEYTIYGLPYYNIDNHIYYPQDCNEEQLAICQATFPKERSLSLQIHQEQLLGGKETQPRTFSYSGSANISCVVNEELIRFYNSYPTSSYNDDIMTRWAMYANTPLCKQTRERLYPQLKSALERLPTTNAVQYLLSFVQNAFVYEYDDKIWGNDRAFFAEETLFYPYADCEDRSILFTRLVRDLLELRCALVYSPGHLYAAVCMPTHVNGDALIIGNERFLICDPTYINADVGMMMPGMKKEGIRAIILE